MEINNTPSSKSPDYDIVFVHGIGSNAHDAWANQDGDLWPLWLRLTFPHARILLLNYPAPKYFSFATSSTTIRQRGRNLTSFLPTIGIGVRPTIFVCHSLGGLVVKEIIRCAAETVAYSHIAQNFLGVIFIATPHLGAPIAGLASVVGSELVQDLTPNSPYLVELGDWFSKYARENKTPISAYCELQRYNQFLIVPEGSADPRCDGCAVVPLDYNHSSISKPRSPSVDIYLRLMHDLSRMIASVEKMATSLTSIQDILNLPSITNGIYHNVIHAINRQLELHHKQATVINRHRKDTLSCIIISEDPEVIQSLTPLQQKFPDRFEIHSGIMGDFLSPPPTAVDIWTSFARYAKQLLNITAKADYIRISTFWRDVDSLFLAAPLHLIEKSIIEKLKASIAESSSDRRNELSSLKGLLDRYAMMNEDWHFDIAKRLVEDESYCDYLHRLTLISMAGYDAEADGYECRVYIHKVERHTDVVILKLAFSDNDKAGLDRWIKLNNRIECTNKESSITDKLLFLANSKPLKIDDIRDDVWVYRRNELEKLTHVMVLSGGEPKAGDSGTPIFNADGAVVGMVIGRTHIGGVYKYLAADLTKTGKELKASQ